MSWLSKSGIQIFSWLLQVFHTNYLKFSNIFTQSLDLRKWMFWSEKALFKSVCVFLVLSIKFSDLSSFLLANLFSPDSLKGFQDFVRLLVSALKTPSDTWFLETDVLIYSLLVHCIIFVLIAVFLNYLHLFWLLPNFYRYRKSLLVGDTLKYLRYNTFYIGS